MSKASESTETKKGTANVPEAEVEIEIEGFDLASLRTDKVLEQEGVWCTMGTKGCELLIARLSNPRYKAYARSSSRAQKLAMSLGSPDLEEATILATEAAAHTILLDWKKIYLDKKLLPYSHENALKMMTEYPDFYDLVMTFSQDRERFKGEKDVADSKNS